MPYDDQILYRRKGMSKDRFFCYRIIARGLGWVRIVINDGMVPGKSVTLDNEEFDMQFEPTEHRIEQMA